MDVPSIVAVPPFSPKERISTPGAAYLYKSYDEGESWINATDGLSDQTEAVAYDLITRPEDPDHVLAGLGGTLSVSNKVMKSTDGGESWHMALEETGVHSFARSLQHPERIYAGGRDASTRLFFVSTTDFGETWEKEIFDEGPSVVTTHDIAVMRINGQEVLFFATDHGLFSYRAE